MIKKREKWFNKSGKYNWHADDPAAVRRRNMLKAHDNDALAAARASQALSNIMQWPKPKEKLGQDAKYLYGIHKQRSR